MEVVCLHSLQAVVTVALRNNGIKFVAFDQGVGRNKNAIEQFKQDDTITVFLLHAERERWVEMQPGTMIDYKRGTYPDLVSSSTPARAGAAA